MTTRYKPATDLIETDLGTELALLNPTTQAMFSLNKTGRLIWQVLPQLGIGGAAQAVVKQFDVSPKQAEQEAKGLVESLLESGLLEPV